MSRSAYPNDLTDAEWHVLFPLLPPEASVGRPRKWSFREILDGIFCVLGGGIAWRAMPHDLPPGQTVYHYHRLWRLHGVWEALHTILRGWSVSVRVAKRPPAPRSLIANPSGLRKLVGLADTMGARKSVAGNVTCSSTPWGW